MDPSTRTFFIAGVQFRPKEHIATALEQIAELNQPRLLLVGEPSNAYDRYAVKVMFNDIHLGYVPKPINVDVWALRDGGLKPVATLVECNPSAKPYEMFKVQVEFKKPATE